MTAMKMQWRALVLPMLFVSLLATIGLDSRAETPVAAGGSEPRPESFGTAMRWTSDIAAAQEEARRDSKLLYIMHLSGNFQKNTFT